MQNPLISVIIATYNRSEVLRFSIRSVLHQTKSDWELLIIGDGCTDDTEQIVQSFEDYRIRFVNLKKRCGDQSDATNWGIRSAKGTYLAFLNHDDLWFPDHLARSIEELERSHSDLVYTLQFDIDPDSTPRINLIYPKEFLPFLMPNISTWTCRRHWALLQKPMRSFRNVFTYPSADWLTRAWKQKARFRSVSAATVLIFTTLTRKKTYTKKDSSEHAFWFGNMEGNPQLREQLFTQAFQHPKPSHLQGYSSKELFRALLLRLLKMLLQRCHCNPLAWVIYLKNSKKWGIFPMRGALAKILYRKRGLNMEDVCRSKTTPL